ncbi:MAG: FHA domain-containing protein [Planctomycetota bacterium]
MADAAAEDSVLYVEVRGEENHGRQFEIGPDGLLVGRSGACDIVFQNREVSRRHAYLYANGEVCTVEDLASVNGVFVNGRQVKREKLRKGDVVDIGPSRLIIRVGNPDSPPPALYEPAESRLSPGKPESVDSRHPLAVAALIFGLLASMHWAFGPPAIMLALLTLWEIRAEPGGFNRSLVTAALVLGLVGGLANGWFGTLAPRLREQRVTEAREACRQNLYAISRGLRGYAEAHSGREPEALRELVSEGLLDPERLACPGARLDGLERRGYSYFPVGTERPYDVVVADRSPDYHQGKGGWVLRRNGRVEWVPGRLFVELLAEVEKPATGEP